MNLFKKPPSGGFLMGAVYGRERLFLGNQETPT